jgi:cytidylate kinase
MGRTVVCISATTGAGAHEVVPLVAEKLGFRVVDEGVIARAMRDAELIRGAIAQAAEQGEVVIVSHTASILLAGREDLLRVLITGSAERRVARIATARGVSEQDAAQLLSDEDTVRADYLNRFHDERDELPTDYDLVLDTDRLSIEEAAEFIAQAAR